MSDNDDHFFFDEIIEDPEDILKRNDFSIKILDHNKELVQKVALALDHKDKIINLIENTVNSMSCEIAYLKEVIKKNELEIREKNSEIENINKCNYRGLERIPDDNNKYWIGVISKHNKKLYLPENSPKDLKNIENLTNLKEENEKMKKIIEDLINDNKKKEREKRRALSRSSSDKFKLENNLKNSEFYVDLSGDKLLLPYKIKAGGRFIAEIRASHSKIMIFKNRNSAWFFKFGDINVGQINLSQLKTNGIPISTEEIIMTTYVMDGKRFEASYVLKKSTNESPSF